MEDVTIDRLCAVLEGLDLPGFDFRLVRPDSLLVDDLGLDSIRFVDLTVALEKALGIEAFPMQEWVDDSLENDRLLSVGGLAAACNRALASAAGVGA